jgi:hypothetical protein
MGLSSDYQTLLANRGVQLAVNGLREKALQRADALYAVELLRSAAVPILGGDVWLKRGDKIEPAYANWHTDRMIEEQESEYFRRSWDSTERYVREFREPGDAEPLFVLVTGRK